MRRFTDREIKFIEDNEGKDVDGLRLKYSAKGDSDFDLDMCLDQIEALNRFERKLPSFFKTNGVVFAPRMNLEQSSSEQTALYKQGLIKNGETLVDLTSGFGVDSFFLAQKASRVVCVEMDERLSRLCAFNFRLMGLTNCEFVNVSCEQYLQEMDRVDVIYVDPSRRDEHKNRFMSLSSFSPDILTLMPQLIDKASRVIVKLSPMTDLKLLRQEVEYLTDIHIVSLRNECKEVLAVISKSEYKPLMYHCINMLEQKTDCTDFFFEKAVANLDSVKFSSEMKKFFFEPNSSFLKAGIFTPLCMKYNVEKLHPNTHLFTSDERIGDFEGRGFELLEQRSAGIKALRDIERANITVRNFPWTVETIRKRTKIKEGGDLYLFFTTLLGERKVCLLARKI